MMSYTEYICSALDKDGFEYERAAAYVGELPTQEIRIEALEKATLIIESIIGIKSNNYIKFGMPVFTAFGLTKKQAINNENHKLLLVRGDDVPLNIF